MKTLPLLTIIALLVSSAVSASAPRRVSTSGGEVQRVTNDLCDSKLVFLGEDGGHGGGNATVVRADLVVKLIQQCNFRHVVFESSIYEFEDLKARYKAKTATKADLYNAIGGLWSTTSELDSLVNFLHAKALSRNIEISGMDGQSGSATGRYTHTELAAALTRSLPLPRARFCQATISRLNTWAFDEKNPYDDAFKQQIGNCMEEIDRKAQAKASDYQQRLISHSYTQHLKFTAANLFNQRDQLMHENLNTILRHLPNSTKTIVWTANVHAMRTVLNGKKASASYAVDLDAKTVKSIAVVALSGSHGRYGQKPTVIEPASQESLEASASTGKKFESDAVPGQNNPRLLYIPASKLQSYNNLESRVLGYSSYRRQEWSKLFDGIIVLEREQPPNFVRPPKPMQTGE